jgi:5'-3' exonuclease
MGVDGLLKASFVTAYMKMWHLSKFSGKRFALDVSAFLILFLYGIDEEHRNNFLNRAKNLFQLFRRYNIKIVAVWDGRTPNWKFDERARRLEERKRKREEKDDAKDELDNRLQQKQKLELELSALSDSPFKEEEEQKSMIQYEEIVKVHIEFDIQSIYNGDEDEPGSSTKPEINVLVRILLESDYVQLNKTQASQKEQKDEWEEERKKERIKNRLQTELRGLENQIIEDEQKFKDKSRLFIDVRPQDKVLLRELLDMMHVPSIESKYEADYVFGSLARSGDIDGAICNDSDTLWHNCNFLCVRKLSDLMHTESVEYYEIGAILKGLKYSPQLFMDMCFAIDTDYRANGLLGIGILRITDEIKANGGSIEGVVNNLLRKKQEAIQELERKMASFDEKIEKSTAKIEECWAKKNPNTKTNIETIEKAELKIAEMEMKKVTEIPKCETAIEKHKAAIEEIEEYLPWYYDIREKVLQKHTDGTFKIKWQTLAADEFNMADVLTFLQRHCYN